MTFEELQIKARQVRALYAEFEKEKYGRSWTRQELLLGFIGDIGDLSKLAIAKEGARDIEDADVKIKHELADCLWSVLVLADAYDVDLQKEFTDTMDKLEVRIAEKRRQP